MSDDYLWDRSGERDADVERLEQLLGRYRHNAPLQRQRRWWEAPASRWAAAAMLAIILGAALVQLRLQWTRDRAWSVTAVHGSATIDGEPVRPSSNFAVGETLRTGPASSVSLRVARIGELEVEPGSVVTLQTTESKRHRIALARGTIAARVWAPPFVFGVNTPAGVANDLGCAFRLSYAGDQGLLHVTSGWVEFEGALRSALIPAGAAVELTPIGPGTPYYVDTTAAFRDALRRYDAARDEEALQRVVRAARVRDTMSLLHLIGSAPPQQRALLFEVTARFAPPPAGVTRERIINGDPSAVDTWRKSIGLTGVKRWWLNWRDAVPTR